MKKALVHKTGINCGKQVRKETTLDTEVTCPACLVQLHYETPGYTRIMSPLNVEIGEGVDLTFPREYKDVLKFPLP